MQEEILIKSIFYRYYLIFFLILSGASFVVHGDAGTVGAAGLPVTLNPSLKHSISSSSTSIENTDNELARLTVLRQYFLQAEQAVNNNNKAEYERLANQLKAYPLYPYLQYQWLRKHMGDYDSIKRFLAVHADSRYAALLKRQWLYHLAKKQQWHSFLQVYTPSRDVSLQCYYQHARYAEAENDAEKQVALNAALKLWGVGYSQAKACDAIFALLNKHERITVHHKWQRFDAALQNNQLRLARYIKKMLPDSQQAIASLWLMLHNKPQQHLAQVLDSAYTQTPLMFAHAVRRLARIDVHRAIDVWDQHHYLYAVDNEHINKIERQLAFKLAHENDAAADERLATLHDADTASQIRRVRLALQQQNWPQVMRNISALNAHTQASEKWQYWQARAHIETGHPQQANEILHSLASKRDYYGYLAAELLGWDYQLSHQPLDVSAQQIKAVAQGDAFRVAFELMVLDRHGQAKQQWWYAVAQLDKTAIPAAAKLAQNWLWHEVAIFTIAKAKQWDDVELRFPLSYREQIQAQADLYDIDASILFGLIRRESAFNENAVSPVGARGLMQIMPRTGKQIANELNEHWQGKTGLFDAEKNLRYGSYYYQQLFSQFDEHYAVALAAYNAGPNRVKQWLPHNTLPADIWIETIPFSETREYVINVIAYAMIYQQLMGADELTMADLTEDIEPLDEIAFGEQDNDDGIGDDI